MVQLITEHSVLLREQSLKEAGIGVEAAGIQDAVVAAMETRYLLLQLLVDILTHTERGMGSVDVKETGMHTHNPMFALEVQDNIIKLMTPTFVCVNFAAVTG